MRIQTILNSVEKVKSFVYQHARWEERDSGAALVVRVEPRKESRRSAPGVGNPVRPMTAWRNGASSSCRCGVLLHGYP
jgi:hypothetical protein